MPFYSLTCQQAEAVAKLVDYKADQILFHHGAQEGSQLPEYKDLCSIVQELKSGGRVFAGSCVYVDMGGRDHRGKATVIHNRPLSNAVESGEVPDSE